jgi:hexosaminidase
MLPPNTHSHIRNVTLGLASLVAAWDVAQGQHAPLLPRVQQISYGVGSIPLCRLSVSPSSAKQDDLARTQLRDLLNVRCPKPLSPAIPISLISDTTDAALPGNDEHPGPDSRESYAISSQSDRVLLHARTSAGLFYAVQTLRQLIEGSTLPLVEIKDWPSLPYRGFMMDMSHGAVLTVTEVERQIDILAQWKGNQYYFYVETDLDLKGYPLLHKESNWSPEDIQTIVEYARVRHVDVVPCVELFGHLHDLFRIEHYSHMAALPHGGEANPANKGAQSILEDWLRQYAALFPSPWLHLGFDEPFELERAGSLAAGGVPPDTLWLQHLQRMARVASSLGKRPLFWADIDEGAYIFNKYPGLAAGLPKGAIATPWFYDARPDYSNLLDLFSTNHVPILVATGISDWDNIAPDFESTFTNIDGFLAAGRKAKAFGMINTEWSDSALALHREALPALAYGAVAAWQSTPVVRSHFFSDYAHLLYAAPVAEKVATALTSLTQSQSLLHEALGSETSFRMFDDPFRASTLARAVAAKDKLREARLDAETAEQNLIEAMRLPESTAAQDDLSSLLLASRMLDYAGTKFLYATEITENFSALAEHPSKADVHYLLRREATARNHSRVGDLLDTSGELAQQYRDEWLKQYKPFRLSTALARWQAEQAYWLHFQASVWTVTRDFKEGDAKPTLEQVLAMH